ncbi:unnamed protein product [Thlaspi arvense]|uniref:SIAH-type domain-containing protein n=1 Tax=Thlaspi arvense TaxID=13288 RepID=A0AAU9SA75_THLAR|nr:unnamed protein product [Thlaspi arvense]
MADGLNNSTSQKRQRTSKPSDDTDAKKKRTATLLDLDAIDCSRLLRCFEHSYLPGEDAQRDPYSLFPAIELWSMFLNYLESHVQMQNLAALRVSLMLKDQHINLDKCAFAQRACPFSSCDFIGSSLGIYEHSVAKHCKTSRMFDCEWPVFVCPSICERIILKERTTAEGEGEGEFVVVECFDTSQGRIIYASCIGPGTEKFSYSLKFHFSDGDLLRFESRLKRVCEVSNEPPDEPFMMVPSRMCPDYKLQISIRRKTS